MRSDIQFLAMRALIVQEIHKLKSVTAQEVEHLGNGVRLPKHYEDAVERINRHVELINGAMAVINAGDAFTSTTQPTQ
jgi:hypothetical protein